MPGYAIMDHPTDEIVEIDHEEFERIVAGLRDRTDEEITDDFLAAKTPRWRSIFACRGTW